MSKINQIQNAIKELDGGAFQKLADSYLKKKGYDNLMPLGSVIGANKVRKGTPSSSLIAFCIWFIFDIMNLWGRSQFNLKPPYAGVA